MNRRRARALGRSPGYRPIQRPVELEHARPIAVATECATIASRQTITNDLNELTWRDIEQQHARWWQLRQRGHSLASANLAAESAQVARQRIGDSLRATARDRPAAGVAQRRQ